MSTEFADFPLPSRQSKPRTVGLSMMIDWGMGLERQKDTVESSGEYVDIAKIAAGIARLMPAAVLREKVRHYEAHGIRTSPGGLFAELALKLGRYERFLEQVLAAGFSSVEVSDNLLDLAPADKASAIRRAREAGLCVYGEVGRKEGAMDDTALLRDVANCLEAGADRVFLEAAELFSDNDVRADLIAALAREFPLDRLIYELPVVVLPRVTRDYKHQVAVWLVKELGTDVNLANIEWDELYLTELVRLGFAGDTSHPQGAYRMAGIHAGEA